MTSRTWSLVLAAGRSERFGGVKAEAPWLNGTLLSQAVSLANGFSEERVGVVLGGHAEVLKPKLVDHFVTENPNWEKGIGTSISWGIQQILGRDPKVMSIVILPIDQPLIAKTHLQELVRVSLETDRCVLTKSAGRGYGPPAVIPRKYFTKAFELNSDRGLKSVLEPQDFTSIENADAMMDADTPEELQKLNQIYTTRGTL